MRRGLCEGFRAGRLTQKPHGRKSSEAQAAWSLADSDLRHLGCKALSFQLVGSVLGSSVAGWPAGRCRAPGLTTFLLCVSLSQICISIWRVPVLGFAFSF